MPRVPAEAMGVNQLPQTPAFRWEGGKDGD